MRIPHVEPAGVLLLLPLSLAFAACGASEPSPSPGLERRDSAGVEIVEVLGTPTDTVWLEVPLLRIGSADPEGAQAETFALISDVVALPAGGTVVVDNRGGRVAAFDAGGPWLRDVGRRGEGPGEHMGPLHAAVRADTLFVWDALQRRMSRYGATSGSFLGATTLPEWSNGRSFNVVEEGYVVQVESGQLTDPAPARGAVVRVARDGRRADTLVGPYPVPEYGWTVTDPENGTGRMVNPPAFSVYPPWTVSKALLLWMDPLRATVEVRDMDSGRIVRSVRLPRSAAPPTAEDRQAWFRSLQDGLGLSDEAMAAVRDETTFAEVRPPVADLRADDPGRMWIADHDPAGGPLNQVAATWTVVDLVAERVTVVRFPRGFQLKRVREDRAVGITTLPTGAEVVDVFRVPDLHAIAASP